MIPTKEQREEIACIDQRTPDWFRARLGCITGSCVHFVMKKSDAEKAYEKALAIGPVEVESKTEFNARINPIKKSDPVLYEQLKAQGQLKETKAMFEERMGELKSKIDDNPFPDTTMSYLYQLASERNLRPSFVENDYLFEQYQMRIAFSSKSIRWGEEAEQAAREQYQKISGNEVVEVGFTRHLAVDWYGDSPDGLVVDSESGKQIGAIEIKCPKPDTWIRYRHEFRKAERLYNQYVKEYMELHPEIDSDAFTDDLLPLEHQLSTLNTETLKRIKPEYYWQCQSHCECNDVDWCDFIFYDMMQKGESVVVRVYRGQADIDLMLKRIELANKVIENDILA